eukprot:1159271-Pelagomonas_calceolata.AAC.6
MCAHVRVFVRACARACAFGGQVFGLCVHGVGAQVVGALDSHMCVLNQSGRIAGRCCHLCYSAKKLAMKPRFQVSALVYWHSRDTYFYSGGVGVLA